MFVEPVMGAGGVIVPPKGYFERIVPILRAHDILLVVDEVICGFGRLGTPFGSNYYKLEPDLMTIAKGLTSGYLPMSACLVSERVWEDIRERSRDQGPFAHGYTYSGHPTPAAVALANLDLMERERLFDRAASTGAYLQQRLRELASHPLVGEVRGVGMIAGVELVQSKAEKKPFPPALLAGAKVSRRALADGLITRALRDTLAFSPPLILEKSDVDRIVEIVGPCARRDRERARGRRRVAARSGGLIHGHSGRSRPADRETTGPTAPRSRGAASARLARPAHERRQREHVLVAASISRSARARLSTYSTLPPLGPLAARTCDAMASSGAGPR